MDFKTKDIELDAPLMTVNPDGVASPPDNHPPGLSPDLAKQRAERVRLMEEEQARTGIPQDPRAWGIHHAS